MKKSRFLLFIASLIPGAGQMYMGAMRKGLLIMSLFWGVIFVSTILNMGMLIVLLPVIWFYSFFDVTNLKYIPYNQIIEKDRAISFGAEKWDWQGFFKKRHLLVGTGLIVLGIMILFNILVEPVIWQLLASLGIDSNTLYNIIRNIPTMVISVAIIVLGVYLLKGRALKDDEVLLFHGKPENDSEEANKFGK